MPGQTVSFGQVAALEQFAKSVLRFLVMQGHELVTQYGKGEALYSDLFTQRWWELSRVIRNALSHDFCIHLNDKDARLLSLSWQGKTIDLSVNRQPLMLSFCGYADPWRLFLEYENFVLGLSLH